MMRHLAFVAAVFVAAAAGCGSPQPHFYTLSSMGTASQGGTPANVSVVVGPVSIRPVFDQPQIVVTTGPNQVTFDEFNRWATPLPDDISRVVAQDLVSVLGTPHVTLFKQSMNAESDYRVAIDIQAFDSTLGEAASLNAAWIVRRARDGKSQAGRTSVREVPGDKGFDALAAAHSRAIARLSGDIGTAIRQLQQKP
jgi:uncharacterized lipoprotein YmbA